LFVKCGIPKEDMEKRLNFVDLFAGCGGLSLGLEQAGFHPVFVNELNSHAMETYLASSIAMTSSNWWSTKISCLLWRGG